MAYKLLSNLISASGIQHMKGEVVDLEGPLADDLTKRGVVKLVDDAVTHVYNEKAPGSSRGGLPVEGNTAPAAKFDESTHNLAHTPPDPVDPNEDDEDEPDQTKQIQKQPSVAQVNSEPKANPPAKQNTAPAANPEQPTPEQVAQTAANVQ